MNWRKKPKSRGWEGGHDEMRGYFFVKAETPEEYLKGDCPRVWAADIEKMGYTTDEFFDLPEEKIMELAKMAIRYYDEERKEWRLRSEPGGDHWFDKAVDATLKDIQDETDRQFFEMVEKVVENDRKI